MASVGLVLDHDGGNSAITNSVGTLTVSNSSGNINVSSSTGDVVISSNTSTKVGPTDITGDLFVDGRLSTANAPDLYQRWEFGKVEMLWTTQINPTAMTPAGTLNGTATYLTTTDNRRVRLTSTFSDSGDLYWELPATIVNWEFRLLVYVSSSLIFAQTRIRAGATSSSFADSVSAFISNSNIRILDGGSTVTTDTTKTSDVLNGQYREFRLRKIGTEVTSTYNPNDVGAGSSGGQTWITTGTSSGTNGEGTFFYFNGQNVSGLGDISMTYAEIRSFDY